MLPILLGRDRIGNEYPSETVRWKLLDELITILVSFNIYSI